jgi:hypothetical protein
MELSFVVNEDRANTIKAQMARSTDARERFGLWFAYGVELVQAGKTEQGIREMQAMNTAMKAELPGDYSQVSRTIHEWLALAHLRMAEEQNCCATNNADSCLMPIKGKGIHSKREGGTLAFNELCAILKSDPQNLKAKWLLNITAMTLGRYPNEVPKAFLIDPAVFKSEYPLPAFHNVAPQLGLNLLGRAGGTVVEDFDGDSQLDIMISGAGFDDQLRLFHNNGDGTFTERTKEAGLTGETGGLSLVQGDYNNDGLPDVYVLRGGWMEGAARFPCSLLRNDGKGTFTDVTKSAGLMRAGPTQTAVWFDYDNDGWLDLFQGYESGKRSGQHPCALYHNNHDGTFTDVASQAGVDYIAYVKAATSGDYDNDGFPDLFLSVLRFGGVGQCTLLHNNGNGTFTDMTIESGIHKPDNAFSTMFFDYDNDGWLDLFVAGYRIDGVQDIAADYMGLPHNGEKSRLFHNNRNGTFTDASQQTHLDKVILAMGLNFGDLDNDGFLDFYAGTGDPKLDTVKPNRMFRNAGGKVFQEVTTAGNFGHLQKGHGIAFADLNNDGQQDVFIEMGGVLYGDVAYSTLFANPGNKNHWLTLRLHGVTTTKSAIGARIKVTVMSPTGAREIHRVVGTGASFGCNPLRQEIGLGDATSVDSVEILWPVSKKRQELKGLKLDARYDISEDSETPKPFTLKRFPWPKTD